MCSWFAVGADVLLGCNPATCYVRSIGIEQPAEEVGIKITIVHGHL